MTMICPRCKESVDEKLTHCSKCGFSISNYLENKKNSNQKTLNNQVVDDKENSTRLDVDVVTSDSAEDNLKVAVALEKKKKVEDVEENILRFISNIKIVKDESCEVDDEDDIDASIHSFLVETLNDNYKMKRFTTVINNPKELLNSDTKESISTESKNVLYGNSDSSLEDIQCKMLEEKENFEDEVSISKNKKQKNEEDNGVVGTDNLINDTKEHKDNDKLRLELIETISDINKDILSVYDNDMKLEKVEDDSESELDKYDDKDIVNIKGDLSLNSNDNLKANVNLKDNDNLKDNNNLTDNDDLKVNIESDSKNVKK